MDTKLLKLKADKFISMIYRKDTARTKQAGLLSHGAGRSCALCRGGGKHEYDGG
jgi:hypothetical protein